MMHALDFRSSPTHEVTNQPPPLPSQELARVANRNAPELHAFDRFGHRTDVVGFHPAYHDLMQLVFGEGVHSLAWTPRGRPCLRTAPSYVIATAADSDLSLSSLRPARVPCFKRRALLIGRETGDHGAGTARPGQRIAGSLRESAHRQAGLPRGLCVAGVEAGIVRQREP